MDPSQQISRISIEKLIRDFMAESSENSMKDDIGSPAWDDVLVGFASGDDPIWQQYKEYVGAFHWTPWEVYSQHCPSGPVNPEELTMISWVLPQRKAVRQTNRKSRKYPSEEWARIRVYGEAFNTVLRQHVAESLTKLGFTAIAPMLVPNWTIVQSSRFSYASSWSEHQKTYHFEGYGCGLCQVGVPCEAGIPVKSAREMLKKGELPPPPPPLA